MSKIFIILLIALFILGPERLPHYAQKLGELVRAVKRMADGAKDRLKDEMGPDFEDVDWKQLDPRQYDPRRIIRDALLEDEREAKAQARKARAIEAARARREREQRTAPGSAHATAQAAATQTTTAAESAPEHFDTEAT